LGHFCEDRIEDLPLLEMAVELLAGCSGAALVYANPARDLGLGDFELRYLRDKRRREVDFLVVHDGEPWFHSDCEHLKNLNNYRLHPLGGLPA